MFDTTKAGRVLVWLVMLGMLAGCGTKAKGSLYLERSIPRGEVAVRRIAVVPNRLPSNLQDPEYWREQNFKTIESMLTDAGFQVVDYDTAIVAFERSGLPVEDTRSSRDKYADLAQDLGVDAVIVPYYGVSFNSSNLALFVNRANYTGTVTLQVYLASSNDFLARIDASGQSSYTTGLLSIGGVLAMGGSALAGVQAAQNPGESSADAAIALGTLGLAAMLADTIVGIILAAPAPEKYWRKAFRGAIGKGLTPFIAAYAPDPEAAAAARSGKTVGRRNRGKEPAVPMAPLRETLPRDDALPSQAQPPPRSGTGFEQAPQAAPPALQPVPVPQPPAPANQGQPRSQNPGKPAAPKCGNDSDCPGNLICEGDICVSPP